MRAECVISARATSLSLSVDKSLDTLNDNFSHRVFYGLIKSFCASGFDGFDRSRFELRILFNAGKSTFV